MNPPRPAAALLTPLILLVSGCSRPDPQAELDIRVTQDWMRPGLYIDAIEYLEQGGSYYSVRRVPGGFDMDREAILPLLKELKHEFGEETELYAILLEHENYAWGFVMKLPRQSGEARVEAFLEEAQETFPGMILTEWGHEWLSLDFLDKEEAEALRRGSARAADVSS